MADAKPRYFSAMGGEHPGHPGAGGSQRKQSDAHDDLDFDFSMIVDAENDDLDFTLNDAGDVENVLEEQMQPGGNLPSHSSASRSIPIPSGSNSGGGNPQGIPAVTATASIPLNPPQEASQARAIPQRNDQYHPRTFSGDASRPGSHESSGSNFLSGILNPTASTFNNTQLSHTPPTVFGTSYENNHFGKRQRSGSISGRLRSASDLEDRGLIDKNQKGILKDLIICGDEDLQRALDNYEGGDPTALQEMISSGALQNKAVPDLDLLGDLDLDFLTVQDSGDVPETGGSPGNYKLPSPQHPGAHVYGSDGKAVGNPVGLMPPPSFPGKQQTGSMPFARAVPPLSMPSPVHDDGIGELEFTGDFAAEHEGGYYGGPAPTDHQQQFNIKGFYPGNPQRSGAETPPNTEEQRLRSNSLFSALINDPRDPGNQELQYGRWMDHMPKGNQAQMQQSADATGASQTIPIPNAANTRHDADNTAGTATKKGPTRKTPGRRKSDSAVALDRKTKARIKQELAEQKRREKQEKREQKEREKQQKKEERLAAKAEKKKKKEQNKKEQNKKEQNKKEQAMEVEAEEEKPVHVPGSGRPRSMSDPNLRTTTDEFGLLEVERPDGWVGAYSPESRKVRIEKFLAKRHKRVWTKTVKYDVRKNFADSRLRVKGRFVKKEDEMLMRDLMSLT